MAEAEGAADDEGNFAFAVGGELVELAGELFGCFHAAFDGEGDDVGVRAELGEDAFAFFRFDLFHFGWAEFFGCLFVGDFDDLDFGISGQAFGVFGDALL